MTIAGHATSISLEPVFGKVCRRWRREEGLSLAAAIAAIDRVRGANGLPSAIRQVLYGRARQAQRSTES